MYVYIVTLMLGNDDNRRQFIQTQKSSYVYNNQCTIVLYHVCIIIHVNNNNTTLIMYVKPNKNSFMTVKVLC